MNQKGSVNIVLIVIIVAVVAMSGYFVFSKKSTAPTPSQQTSVVYPDAKTFIPSDASLIREFRLDFESDGIDEIVVIFSTNVMGVIENNDTGFVILARQANKEWKAVYNQSPVRGAGIQVSVDSIKAPDNTRGLFVLESEAGAGTSADWYIITKAMKKLDRRLILDQVLNAKGNVFLGYNGAKVVNDLVVETVPGYSKSAARCCPDKPTLEIIYRFTGTSIELVSVKELAKPQL